MEINMRRLRLVVSLGVICLCGCSALSPDKYDPILYKHGYPGGIKFGQLGWGPRFVVVTKSDVDFYSEAKTSQLFDHYIRWFGKIAVPPKERGSEGQHYGRSHQHKAELSLAIALRGQEAIDFIDSFMRSYLQVERLRGQLEALAAKERDKIEIDITLLEDKWQKHINPTYAPLNQDTARQLLDILPFSRSPQALDCLRRIKEQCEKNKSKLKHFVGFAIDNWRENNPTKGNDSER
jgi:hypothetical protein